MNWRFFNTIVQSKKTGVFLLLAAVSFFLFGLQKETITKKTEVLSQKTAPLSSPTPTKTPDLVVFTDPTPQPEADRPLDETPATIMIQVTQMQQQNSEQSKPVIHVSVSGGNAFDVEVSDTANHCDVLTKAQSDGKIHDLLMKFDSSVGSYAVYKMNGLGKDNQVWWTYAVNGQDAPKGCSYIKANHGDQVSWKYIGS